MSELSSLVLAGFVLTTLSTSTGAATNYPTQHTSGHVLATALVMPLNSIVCASQQHCVAVGNPIPGDTKDDAAIAATTSDRGAHWATTPRIGGVTELNALACSTARTCIAVGWSSVRNNLSTEKGVVIRTGDGGHTWMVVSTLPKGVGQLSNVACPTATFCMAVGASQVPSTAVALITNSAGRKWTPLSLPKDQETLTLVACTTRHDCIAAGDREAVSGDPSSGYLTSIIATADSGSTWTQRPLPAGTSRVIGIPYFAAMMCASRTLCVIVGDATPGDGAPSGLIIASTDGGKTWTYDVLPQGTQILNAVSCVSTSHCVVVGGGYSARGGLSRLILTTTDDGETWVSRPVPTAAAGLEGVSCPTATSCVATGFGPSGTIQDADTVAVVTSDGGATWSTMP